jgi:monoamine oxidase
MARSRLMGKVRRILRDEPGMDRATLSRRDLLVSGIAAGAMTLAGLARAQARAGSPRVATPRAGAPRIGIVGAGIAGLTAALTLADRGLSAPIYEASDRIGGRMHSNRGFWREGQTSEWCGEFIDTRHHTIRGLARRFGLTLVDVNAADPPGSVDTNFFERAYYTGAELRRDLRKLGPILREQLKRIGAVVKYDEYTPAGYALDHMSAREWIERYVPGGNASRLGEYLDVAIRTENGLDTTVQSSLNFVFGGSSDERFHIAGGNQQLPEAIATALGPDSIHRGWRLVRVSVADDRAVTLGFEAAEGAREIVFDHVILALPFSVLRHVDLRTAGFDSLKTTAIDRLGYGTNSKLSVQFDTRYWNGRGAWPGVGDGFIDTDLPFAQTWDSSRAERGDDGLLTDYTGGTRGASFDPDGPYTSSAGSTKTARYAEAFVSQLNVVWPGVASHYHGLATLSYPAGDPNLLGSYSSYRVGQYTEFAGYEPVPQGRVHFAGEHTSYNYQGFMEGGAESGVRAASEVLRAAGATA